MLGSTGARDALWDVRSAEWIKRESEKSMAGFKTRQEAAGGCPVSGGRV